MSQRLQSALRMAALGFPVLPLQPGTKKPFQRRGWQGMASRNPAIIRHWFETMPQINYGVWTQGHIVLDVDTKKGRNGYDELAKLGSLPRSFRVKTPSGGEHIYFKGHASQAPIAPGLDIRSDGGYVVGPDSQIDGALYVVVDDAPPVEPPEWLQQRIKYSREKAARADKPAIEAIDSPACFAAAEALLRDAPLAVQGDRDQLTYDLCCELRDLGLSEGAALDYLVLKWNHRNPHAWDYEGLAQKVFNAYAYAQGALGQNSPELFNEVELPFIPNPFQPLYIRDPADIPPRPWISKGYLMRGQMTGIIAPGGAGKSTLTLGWAASLALGRGDIMGLGDIKGGRQRVVIINNEDDKEEIERRLNAWCLVHNVPRRDLDGYLFIHSPHDNTPFVGVVRAGKRELSVSDRMEILRAFMADNKVDVVFGDPWVELHEAEENSNSEIGYVIKQFRQLAREMKAALVLVHHTRKPPDASSAGYAGSADTSRGASAFVNGLRMLFTLVTMTRQEASELGISDRDRGDYSRLDRGKGNYVKRDTATTWFRATPCVLTEEDDSHALQLVDLRAMAERQALVLHAAIREHVVAAGEAGLSIRQAAQIAADDPLLSGQGVDVLRDVLTATFAAPQTVDGVTLYRDVVDETARRRTYCIRAK